MEEFCSVQYCCQMDVLGFFMLDKQNKTFEGITVDNGDGR